MNKPQVEVLIIDDDRTRDPVYEDFFNALALDKALIFTLVLLKAPDPAEALQILRAKRACLVVLDIVLEGKWADYAQSIYEQLKLHRYPIALLSGKFEVGNGPKSMPGLLANLRELPKVGFLPYASAIKTFVRDVSGAVAAPDVLPTDTVEMWNCMLIEALSQDRRWIPAKSGEITFMHLTDTHFGSVTPDLLNTYGIKQGALDSKSIADYLLWTGDVTDHAYPKEYALAEKCISDWRTAGLLSKTCPISIVSGNHDLCWPLALASRLKRQPLSGDAAGNKRFEWKLLDTPVENDLWQFGRTPYNEFFERVVGERRPKDGFRFLTQWAHLGIAVLELPLEVHVVRSRSEQTPAPVPFIDKDTFKKITNLMIQTFMEAELPKHVCVIVMIHGRRPDDASASVERWDQLLDAIEHTNPTIVFAGHEHASSHSVHDRRLTLVGAPLDERKVETLTLPSVGFVRLSGLCGAALVCEITKLEKKKVNGRKISWAADNVLKFRIDTTTGYWSKA